MNWLVEVSNSVYKKEFIQLSDEIWLILNGEWIEKFSENDISKYLFNLETIQEELKKEYRIILDENKDLEYSSKVIEKENSLISNFEIKIRNFITNIKVDYNKDTFTIVNDYNELIIIFDNLEKLQEYITNIKNTEIKNALMIFLNFYFTFFIEKLNTLVHLTNINFLLNYPYYEDIIIDWFEINISDAVDEIVDKFNNEIEKV